MVLIRNTDEFYNLAKISDAGGYVEVSRIMKLNKSQEAAGKMIDNLGNYRNSTMKVVKNLDDVTDAKLIKNLDKMDDLMEVFSKKLAKLNKLDVGSTKYISRNLYWMFSGKGKVSVTRIDKAFQAGEML